MEQGYVYILSNRAFPGMVKVGRSKYGGNKRSKELYATGVPAPYKVEFELLCSDAPRLEGEVHEALGKFRTNLCREFFSCNIDYATRTLLETHIKWFRDDLVR